MNLYFREFYEEAELYEGKTADWLFWNPAIRAMKTGKSIGKLGKGAYGLGKSVINKAGKLSMMGGSSNPIDKILGLISGGTDRLAKILKLGWLDRYLLNTPVPRELSQKTEFWSKDERSAQAYEGLVNLLAKAVKDSRIEAKEEGLKRTTLIRTLKKLYDEHEYELERALRLFRAQYPGKTVDELTEKPLTDEEIIAAMIKESKLFKQKTKKPELLNITTLLPQQKGQKEFDFVKPTVNRTKLSTAGLSPAVPFDWSSTPPES